MKFRYICHTTLHLLSYIIIPFPVSQNLINNYLIAHFVHLRFILNNLQAINKLFILTVWNTRSIFRMYYIIHMTFRDTNKIGSLHKLSSDLFILLFSLFFSVLSLFFDNEILLFKQNQRYQL